MDRYRPYHGKRSATRHRRTTTSTYTHKDRSLRRGLKLAICAGLFVVAAGIKLLFPSAFTAVGDKINQVVNYKAALTSIGEGISGEKKFTTALGEAFTYAFTGGTSENNDESQQVSDTDNSMQNSKDQAASATAATDSAAEIDSDTDSPPPEDAAAVFAQDDTLTADSDAGEASTQSNSNDLSDAIVAAFIQSQDEYSDYAIPAGVTYEMPRISIPHVKPMEGTVSSSFGYRIHPTDLVVKFHYGTDIAAKKGTAITAFADGKVIATGESTTLGNYVIISHGDLETEYAHCGLVIASSGQTVKMGDRIATAGDTGNATETCLHFELKINGVYVNPEYYF